MGKNTMQSFADTKKTKLLIACDDMDLASDQLQQAYEDVHEEEGDSDDNEETRFIKSNRTSFYTSSERTWSTIKNLQLVL